MVEFFIFCFVMTLWIACGIIGHKLAGGMGLFLGLLFGVFGLIVAAIISTKQPPATITPAERPYRHIPKKPKQQEELISARELRMRARAFRDLNSTIDN